VRSLFISLLSITSFLFSNGQITTGNWLVGGDGTFSSDRIKSLDIVTKTTEIQVSPSIGYFFIDKLCGEVKLNYTSNSTHYSSGKSTAHNYIFGPAMRYYFLRADQLINFFAEANYLFGFSKVTGTSGSSGTDRFAQYSLLAGPVIFFNSCVGLEFTIGYNHSKQADADLSTSSLRGGIGFKIHLEK
jgi:hypothetical protein